MAESTLYDVLEVSSTASAESIDAAYQRLVEKFDPAKEANTHKPHARVQLDAVKQAYLTLGDAEKRAIYDRRLMMRNSSVPSYAGAAPVNAPFWSVPKMLIAGAIIIGATGFYFNHQKEQARIEAEKVVALAKAREAEAKARADAEEQRLGLQRERQRELAERREANRVRAERDADLRQHQRDVRTNEVTNRVFSVADREQARRDDNQKRSEEQRIKREEAQAATASRQQLARDRAELCRIERERYGKSISC